MRHTIKLDRPEFCRAFSFKFDAEPAIAKLENNNSVEMSNGLLEKSIMSGKTAALAASGLEVPREFSKHIAINKLKLNIAWQEYLDESMKHYPH